MQALIDIDEWRENFSEDAGGSVAPPVLATDNEASFCKSEKEIREYMDDKLIVVYVAHSYLAQEDQEPNNNELITTLTPIVEKQLDFRLHKNVNALIQEV